jgi:peptide/nickel transport system permease protein
MTLYVLLGVPFGIAAATRAGSRADKGIQALSVFGLAIPSFWLALFMQLIFFYWLRWLPSVGRLDMGMVAPRTITGLLTVDSVLAGDWAALGSTLRHLILPATTLALAGLANIVRLTRRSMLEILHEDYIKAARAKGLSERTVIYKHAFRNALIPVLTMIGLQAGYMLSGAVLVEVVFSWPGVGGYIVESIAYLDFQPIMGATLLIALGFLAINFAVDVLYVVADPRVGWS